MQIFTSLGVDSTIVIHLICFLISYVALTQLILKPYMRALEEREKRTVGGEELAVRLVEEAADLQGQYEVKAREINSQITSIYNQSRTAAQKDSDVLVDAARKEASGLLETSRAQISTEVQAARKTLSAEVPAVGAAIASKLAGKDLSL
jgi:F-type H+-transporting ATPase subunit b